MSDRPIVLPDTFNGEGSSWSEWKYHFTNVAQVNGWDDEAKLLWLRVRLVGRAQRNIQRLSEDLTFTATIKALDERFEPSSRRARYQAELQVRKKLTTEGWAEYADDLRLLAERSFPDMSESAREQLALQVYFRQLHHPQVAFSVKQKQPATLDEAVTATIEMETYLPPKTAAAVSNLESVTEEQSAPVCPVTTASKRNTRDEEIQLSLDKIVQRIEALETVLPTTTTKMKNIKCYNCGKEGHIARYCRHDYPKQPTPQRGQSWNRSNVVRPIGNNKNTKGHAIPLSCHKNDSVSAICAGGYRVKGKVNGVTVNFLVDSGAAITLMRSDVWQSINNNHPQKLSAHNTAGLVGVEGSSLTIHGCTTVNLQLGNREIETDVMVASPLITDAILGVDFLQKHKARIDIPSQRLILTDQGTVLPLQHSSQSPLGENVVIVFASRKRLKCLLHQSWKLWQK